MSFRLKTILGVALIEAVLLATLIFHFLDYLAETSERELISRSHTNATLFAAIAREAVLAFDLAALETHIDALMTDPGVVYVRVMDRDGRLLAFRGPPSMQDDVFHADHSTVDDADALYDVAVPIESGSQHIGEVQAGFDMHQLHLDQQQARRTGLSLALVEMVLVALFSAALGVYLTRQLSALITGSRALAKGELGYQVPVRGQDELAAAARAFNHMSARLKEDHARRTAILRSSLDALITVDDFGFVNDFNPAASALFGLTRKQALGLELEKVFNLRPSSHNLLGDLQRAVESDHSQGGRLEIEVSAHNGRNFPAEISITTSDLPSGPLTTLYIRDITDRIEYEGKLRKLTRAVEQTPTSIVITDRNGTIEYVNPYFTQLTGYQADEAIGNTPRIIKSGRHPREMYHRMWATITHGEIWRGELINRKKSGDLYWEYASITPIRDRHGKITHYIGIKEDISELKHTEEALRSERAFLQDVIDGVTDPIMVIAPDYRVLLSNRAAKLRNNLQSREASHSKCHTLAYGRIKPCSGTDTPCPLQTVIETGKPSRAIHQYTNPNGSVRSHELLASPLWNEDGSFRGVIESSRDITEHMRLLAVLKDERSEMQHLAHHDSLTALPNRLLFTLRLEQAVQEAPTRDERFALLFIDLDRFKQINDSLGHQAGDELLRAVAARVSAVLREQDTLARLGGDEFVVLARGLKRPEDASLIAEKILQAMCQPIEISAQQLKISGSVGICTYPEDGIDAASLLERADAAMYRTKQGGRNGYQFFSGR